MAATQNVPLEMETGDRNTTPVAAGVRLFQGAMAWLDYQGRLTNVPGNVFMGHMAAEADNRNGAAAAISGWTRYGRYRAQVALTGVALTDVGSPVYATDDNIYALTGDYPVGKVVRYVSANVAVVEFISPVETEVGSV